MALDPNFSAAFDFISQAERFYAGLIQGADTGHNPTSGQECCLGGKLLYAGELNASGRALVIAGNVAGAGSLAATADPAAQRQAIRDGVVDFLVTSLDEALRILKNEIRKRETVAVCVGAAPGDIAREMLERGVLPDLLAPGAGPTPEGTRFLGLGARRVEVPETAEGLVPMTWEVAASPARWLPKLDAIAADSLKPGEWAARRWLRLARRYLGRTAQGMGLLCCDETVARGFLDRVRTGVGRGEIGVAVEIRLRGRDGDELHRFAPSANPQSAT